MGNFSNLFILSITINKYTLQRNEARGCIRHRNRMCFGGYNITLPQSAASAHLPMTTKKGERLRFTDPLGDYDKDGVPNVRDCEPTNRKKHGIPLIVSTYSIFDLYASYMLLRGLDPMRSLIPKKGQRVRNFGREFSRFWYVEKVGTPRKKKR